MKSSLIAGFTALILAALFCPGTSHAERTLKLGAGMHLDENTPGVNAALDIPFGESVLGVSPFFDFFSKSGGGINLLVKKAEGKAWVYVGIGGGFANLRSEGSYIAANQSQQVSASKTQSMANTVLGLEYWASERASIFAQVRGIALFGGANEVVAIIPPADDGSTTTTVDLAVRSLAFQVGLSIKLGGGGGSDDY